MSAIGRREWLLQYRGPGALETGVEIHQTPVAALLAGESFESRGAVVSFRSRKVGKWKTEPRPILDELVPR